MHPITLTAQRSGKPGVLREGRSLPGQTSGFGGPDWCLMRKKLCSPKQRPWSCRRRCGHISSLCLCTEHGRGAFPKPCSVESSCHEVMGKHNELSDAAGLTKYKHNQLPGKSSLSWPSVSH